MAQAIQRYGSAFLRSLLEHDFDGDKDKDGNIFVDRSGKLFEELLESLRTKSRPHQRVIGLFLGPFLLKLLQVSQNIRA